MDGFKYQSIHFISQSKLNKKKDILSNFKSTPNQQNRIN